EVHFFQSDMFQKVDKEYDMIVSNPPYIPSLVVDGLMPEVLQYEPRIALDGKEDGLFFYRILAREGKKHLKKNGRLYLEIGHDQGETVPALLSQEDFKQIQVIKDLGGNDRVVAAVFP
ncbi:MAG: HemK/PrmC family methyltransferase, partial [Lachnospiraceae bacterium]|nr:HemK/PrmC family methyltransferase [Lachnospiraceae bacterium]